jgi:hypothetical protein
MTVEHRRIWAERHGPIPKGWVVHHLNGQKGDNRLENLAALPRMAPPERIVPPYRERIRKLEKLLKQQEENR